MHVPFSSEVIDLQLIPIIFSCFILIMAYVFCIMIASNLAPGCIQPKFDAQYFILICNILHLFEMYLNIYDPRLPTRTKISNLKFCIIEGFAQNS